MKASLLPIAAFLLMSRVAMAHPGHEHDDMSTTEYAVHHWITIGGTVLVAAVLFGAFLHLRRKKASRAAMEER